MLSNVVKPVASVPTPPVLPVGDGTTAKLPGGVLPAGVTPVVVGELGRVVGEPELGGVMVVTGVVTLVPGIVTLVPGPVGIVVGGMVVMGAPGVTVIGLPGTVVVGTSGDVTVAAPPNAGRVTSALAPVVKEKLSGTMLLPDGSAIPTVRFTLYVVLGSRGPLGVRVATWMHGWNVTVEVTTPLGPVSVKVVGVTVLARMGPLKRTVTIVVLGTFEAPELSEREETAALGVGVLPP
jgi:hypothetical protein